jgi:hypothetical protein
MNARAAAVRLLSERHPRVLEIDRQRVMFLDLERGRPVLDEVCRRFATLFPELPAQGADCEYQAGWLADEAGDAAASAKHFGAARFGSASGARDAVDDRRNEIAAAMVASAARAGDAKQLAANIERSAAADASAKSPFARAIAADAYVAAARAWHVAGDAAAELRCWQAALRLFEAVDRPAIARRLARARAAVARATGNAEVARTALKWYLGIGGYDVVVRDLTKLAGVP